ncbi:phosphatase PAP2 family protein [Sphingomonas mesophila]|uniref:phosphatase PAP2 family protein n=1 Tax=Sphingomonas mesophila TaxID=2303576 RepID=UPI000E598C36|nr:phosphatase PAP2 family protein [Sphingomonas mesophila]
MLRFYVMLLPLLAAAVLILAAWVGGPQNAVDFAIVAESVKLRQANPLLTELPAWLSLLGNAIVLLPLSALVALALALIRRWRPALLLTVIVAGERLLLDGIKLLLGRARPDIAVHPVDTHSFSFPSGHAANTMTVLVAIALFALPARHRHWSVPLAVALAAAVGLTRPWLGVHWPSDVLGGWMLAALVLFAACWADRRWRISDPGARTAASDYSPASSAARQG